MKIIFFEIQPWEKELIEKYFPDATITDIPLNKETVKSYTDAEIISTFIYSQINGEVLNQLPNLKFIATRSTGYDHIDTALCKTKNIPVSNVPEYGSNTVAEHAFALILSLTRRIYQSVNQAKQFNFQHMQISGVDLCGKTIGIVGLGKIGQHIAKIARGFEMKIVAYNHSQDPTLASQYDLTYVDYNKLLSISDVITFHLPLTKDTYHILNKNNIMSCKKGSYVINTARGGLIETAALMQALDAGILAGVGLDVLEEEKELSEEAVILSTNYHKEVDLKTIVFDHLLINHPKVLITPHNAFNSRESLQKIVDTAVHNIQAYQKGETYFKVQG